MINIPSTLYTVGASCLLVTLDFGIFDGIRYPFFLTSIIPKYGFGCALIEAKTASHLFS